MARPRGGTGWAVGGHVGRLGWCQCGAQGAAGGPGRSVGGGFEWDRDRIDWDNSVVRRWGGSSGEGGSNCGDAIASHSSELTSGPVSDKQAGGDTGEGPVWRHIGGGWGSVDLLLEKSLPIISPRCPGRLNRNVPNWKEKRGDLGGGVGGSEGQRRSVGAKFGNKK